MKISIKSNLIRGWLVVILLVVNWSCQEHQLGQEQNPMIEKSDMLVDATEAYMIASVLEFPQVKHEPKKGSNQNREEFELKALRSRTVKNIKSAPGKEEKDLFHIVNYKEGGWVIIAGDKRASPILAFSDKGVFITDESYEYPGGLVHWIVSQRDYIEEIREKGSSELAQNELSLSDQTSLWNSCPIQRSITPNSSIQNDCDPTGGGGCQDQYTQVGPLMTTIWNQGCTFNSQMPNSTCPSAQCGKAYAGCVAVAMGQVMKYHNFPSSYNFANMPYNVGTVSTSGLLLDIFNSFPSGDREIDCDGTGVSDNANYTSVFTNNFGYTSASRSSYNSATVRTELNNLRPVILSGASSSGWWIFKKYSQGHMWVTDGYLRAVYCSGQTLLKLHMNWGWGGSQNGFFNYNNFNPTVGSVTYNFNSNQKMIFNIKP
jgi:hypothetical protein